MVKPEEPQASDPIAYMWACIKEELEQDGDPTPGELSRMAREIAGRELAASTIDSWLRSGNSVPQQWEQFETLVIALGAEKKRDWRQLYKDAKAAGKERDRRRPKGRATTQQLTNQSELARDVKRKSGTSVFAASIVAALALIIGLAWWTLSEEDAPRAKDKRVQHDTTPPAQPKVSPNTSRSSLGAPHSKCQKKGEYRVTAYANIVNDAGRGFDDVRPGELFVRYVCPGAELISGRFYGTLPERGISGYIRMAKLEPISPSD